MRLIMDIPVQNKQMAIASVIVIGMTFAFTWLPSESCAQVDNNKPGKLSVGTVVAPPFTMKRADGTWDRDEYRSLAGGFFSDGCPISL